MQSKNFALDRNMWTILIVKSYFLQVYVLPFF